MFFKTLIEILENKDNHHIISWSTKNSFTIHKPDMLKTDILIKYFQNKGRIMFYKQLNLHGFRKQANKLDTDNTIVYKHKKFDKDNTKCIEYILQNMKSKKKYISIINSYEPKQQEKEQEEIQPSYDSIPGDYDIDITEWIVSVSDINRFIVNTQFSTWGINNNCNDTIDFLENVKYGDRLWFVLHQPIPLSVVDNTQPQPILLGVATYLSHQSFVTWPLIDIDMSHDNIRDGCCCQGCWQHHGKHNPVWNIKINYDGNTLLTLNKLSEFVNLPHPSYDTNLSQITRYDINKFVHNLEVHYSFLKFKTC